MIRKNTFFELFDLSRCVNIKRPVYNYVAFLSQFSLQISYILLLYPFESAIRCFVVTCKNIFDTHVFKNRRKDRKKFHLLFSFFRDHREKKYLFAQSTRILAYRRREVVSFYPVFPITRRTQTMTMISERREGWRKRRREEKNWNGCRVIRFTGFKEDISTSE